MSSLRFLLPQALLISSLSAAPGLMPLPSSLKFSGGRLRMDRSFRIAVEGNDARLRKAALRTLRQLAQVTGLPLETELAAGPATLRVRAGLPGLPMPALEENEAYRLEITASGAVIEGVTVIGAIRGLATFVQIVEPESESFSAPLVAIDDQPRFRWRGLLIDVARHWMPVEVIKRNLDGMAAVKLNVLHLHLSDDQGFRIESKRYPKLTGAGSDGRFFTQEQMRDLIGYARERGIRVLPEFDIPGHTGSWFPGYPELSSDPAHTELVRTWGVSDCAMDPTREETYHFLDGFIGEMAALFPDAFFHIGGDEVNGVLWNKVPHIVEFKKAHGMKDNNDLQAYFNKRVQRMVSNHGKIMIGWDEILHPDLPKSIVIQSWRGPKSLAEAARGGYRGLLSSGYYLDLNWPAAKHYEVEPVSGEAAQLSAAEQAKILGGEACMWSEYVTPENIDGRIWPRVAAIAERFWSPAGVTDPASMYERMERVSRRLSLLGLTHRTGYESMLERLAGPGPVEPVKTLAEVVEPVKDYSREEARKYTVYTPLTRMVDTARSESQAAREFSLQVEALLHGRGDARAVRANLTIWRDAFERLAPTLQASELLRETTPVAQRLSQVAAIGIEALDHLGSGKLVTEAWSKMASAVLANAGKPEAELLLMIVPPVKKLVEAVRPRQQ